MAVSLSRRFAERLIREPERGQMRDGPIRYLMMRPDALMGMFALLSPAARDEALAALARSVAEHGGRSVQAYVDSGAVSPEALIATMTETSADLGWGVWEFLPDANGQAITLTVTNSPFAQGAGHTDQPACAPILGIASAIAPHLLGTGATVRETQCAAQSGTGICHFAISR